MLDSFSLCIEIKEDKCSIFDSPTTPETPSKNQPVSSIIEFNWLYSEKLAVCVVAPSKVNVSPKTI